MVCVGGRVWVLPGPLWALACGLSRHLWLNRPRVDRLHLQPMEQLLQQVTGAAHTAAAAAARGLKAAEGAARNLWAKLTAGRQRQQPQQEL